MSSQKQNNENVNRQDKSTSIKYGLVSQEQSIINVQELINSYFKNTKLNKYLIKDEYHFEFSFLSFPNIIITINNLRKVEKIFEKYSNFNFFLIFIDVQNSNCIDFLEKSIDAVIDAGENNYNKKCYIFGFFMDSNQKSVPEEKITTIIDAKGIEYYYCQVKYDEIEKFAKIIEKVAYDSNTIMVEKFLDQKHSELVLDNSKSHCYIF